ncbi:PQQ-like beta-propeller repeat protein [Akkermansiaceae bacterium]|nr:PQQ-like beta-propeller repeat protein [Akkermansiaceae bacterium]
MKTLVFFLLIAALGAQSTFPGLTFHQAPRPLSKDAVTAEWPRFFGPADNCTTPEGPLLKDLSKMTPVFELARGDSYASPILAEGKLLHFHTVDSKETLDCHHPETGQRFWTFSYPIKYRDRYGFGNGPRSSPIIKDGRIYLIGVTAMLHCLNLKSGEILWKRDLMSDYNIPQYFFGYGPNPLVYDNKLIINVGGRSEDGLGVCAAGLDIKTGKTLWTHEDSWGASYASPIITKLHGKPVVAMLAAGESRPTHGGLLILDPHSGKLYSRFPWRAKVYESVLASTPLALPGNKIFISDCYEKGGVLLKFDENLQPSPIWTERWFGMHMMTPQLIDGHLYGFAGRNTPDTQLKGINLISGKISWENDMRWEKDGRTQSLFRGSFLKTPKRVFALGEDGCLSELELNPQEAKTLQRNRLFTARETWTPPALHQGLLYVAQNSKGMDGSSQRLICYDLRPMQPRE